MAFDFPASPTEGQLFTPPGGPTYVFNTPRWLVSGGASPPPVSFRNRIINGDFQIDQRNAHALKLVNTDGVYGPDRWFGSATGGGTFYLQAFQAAGQLYVPTQTLDASLAAGDYYFFGQNIEGYNIRDLGWGAAGAKPITISFWAYCTVATGPFTVAVRNGSATRSWLGTFTMNAASTYEKKTFTIPGDTTGTWATDNTAGLNVYICLGAGSTFGSGAAGWQAGNHLAQAGQVNFMAATQAIYVKDFQLETGSVATEFERVPYDEQLRRCQRYFSKVTGHYDLGYGGAGQAEYRSYPHPVSMRAVPTAAKFGTWHATNCGQPIAGGASINAYYLAITVIALGQYQSFTDTITDDYLTFNAEL